MKIGDQIEVDQMTILYSIWWECIWKITNLERRDYAFQAFIEAHALNVGNEETRWYISKLTDPSLIADAEEILANLPSITPRDSLGCLLTYMPLVNAPFNLSEYILESGVFQETDSGERRLSDLPPWAVDYSQ